VGGKAEYLSGDTSTRGLIGHATHADRLLAGFGAPIPPSGVAYSADQAVYVATELGGWYWAVKAQIEYAALAEDAAMRDDNFGQIELEYPLTREMVLLVSEGVEIGERFPPDR